MPTLIPMDRPTLVLGTMSGTSCDGLDLALCAISEGGGPESCTLLAFTAVPYTEEWSLRLRGLAEQTAEQVREMESQWTRWVAAAIGAAMEGWMTEFGTPDLVGFSGHTWYHEPGGRGTAAIGDAAWLSGELGLPVVADYRSADVAAGGQGAPLVPLFDAEVFGRHAACLNLGGIANVTLLPPGVPDVVAWDVAGCNLLLNRQAQRLGLRFDKEGACARMGEVDSGALARMLAWPYLEMPPPKSLAAEDLAPLHSALDAVPRPEDALATGVAWIAAAVSAGLARSQHPGSLFVTGGGAMNDALTAAIADHLPEGWRHEVPLAEWVDGKEAAAFAWLAWRTMRGMTTSLASVTGASSDVCGGVRFGNFAPSGNEPDSAR